MTFKININGGHEYDVLNDPNKNYFDVTLNKGRSVLKMYYDLKNAELKKQLMSLKRKYKLKQLYARSDY